MQRSFWSDPFLWIHLAGIVAFPLCLEACWVALAVGDPQLPPWLELGLVAVVGIAPIVWMQWVKPFNIFSILVLAIKPSQLTEEQRRILALFKRPIHRFLSLGLAVVMIWVLGQLYQTAPLASGVVTLPGSLRIVALPLAAIAFLAANLFIQVPLGVLAALFTSETTFGATNPYPVNQITQDFFTPGIQLTQLLPPLQD